MMSDAAVEALAKNLVEYVCQWVETAGRLDGKRGQRNLSFSLVTDREGNAEPALVRIQREVTSRVAEFLDGHIANLTARLASAEDQYRRELAELANTSVSDDTYDAMVNERDVLKATVEQAQTFLDYEVRAWLGEYTHHTNCGIDSGCSHGKHERGMYEMLDGYVEKLAALTPAAGGRRE